MREPRQLFNSMDPSPFRERDLDPACERFIVDWARELPADAPLRIEVHLEREPLDAETRALVADSLRAHFAREVDARSARLRFTVREGRRALAVGLVFLAACTALANALARSAQGALGSLVAEGLSIAGWVAMWRPMEVFLYELWPLRRERALLRRLAAAEVELSAPPPAHSQSTWSSLDSGR